MLHCTENPDLVRRRGRWMSMRVMEIYLQDTCHLCQQISAIFYLKWPPVCRPFFGTHAGVVLFAYRPNELTAGARMWWFFLHWKAFTLGTGMGNMVCTIFGCVKTGLGA